MRLVELNYHDSGAHAERRISFHPGLNIIYESKEGARRALWNDLLNMLYGPPIAPTLKPQPSRGAPRSGRRRASPLDPIPSINPADDQLDGSLLVVLDNGRELRVRRRIHAGVQTVQALDARTGAEVTADFQKDREVAERYLGLNRQVFVAAACVRAEKIHELLDDDEFALANELSRVLDSATARTSSYAAVQRLDRKLTEIGGLYSPGTSMAAACAKRDELQGQLRLYQSARQEDLKDMTEADELAAETEILQTRLAVLERQSLSDRAEEIRARLARHDDCRRQIERITGEQAALVGYKDFPIHEKEKFFRLYHQLSHIDKLLEVLFLEKNELELKLMALAERSNAGGIDERLWEHYHFEDFYAFRTQWQATFEQILALETAKHEADSKLEAAGLDATERAILAGLDLSRLERVKEEDAKLKAEAQEVERRRLAYDNFQNRSQSHRRVGAIVALAALAAIASGLLHLDSRSAESAFWSGVLPLFISVSGLLAFLFFNYRWLLQSRQLASELLRAEKTYMANQRSLRDLLDGFKVHDVDELVRQRMLFVEIGAASQDHARRTEELARLEQILQPWLEPLGIGHIAIETLASAEARWRESHQLWTEKTNGQERLQRIEEQVAGIQKDREKIFAEVESALQNAGIAQPPGEQSFQAYAQACQKREYLETLQAQISQIEALADEILRGKTYEATVVELHRLEQSLQKTIDAPRLAGNLETEPGPEQIRERIRDIETELVEKQRLLTVNRERRRRRQQQMVSWPELDEALALVEGEIGRLQKAQNALHMARHTLLTVRQHVYADFAQRANALLAPFLHRVAGRKYSSATLNANDLCLQLVVRQDATNLREVPDIAIDGPKAIALFLRFSLPQLMSDSQESIPLLVEAKLPRDMEVYANTLRLALEWVAEKSQIFCVTQDMNTTAALRQKLDYRREMEVA
jgi:hypothetical protein